MKHQLAILYGKTIKAIKRMFGYQIGLIKPLKALHLYLTKNLKTRTANVFGHTMFLDPNDDLSLSINGEFEPMETSIVKKMVKKGDYVIDIGANIGYYTLIMAKLVGETGKVFAFEPDPNNFELLKKNVEYNGYKNVVLFNQAVSNENGTLKLYYTQNGSISRTFDAGDGRRSMDIQAVRLDDVIKEKVDFIKIDIEGFEIMAMKGAYNILNTYHPTVISEFTPRDIAKLGFKAKDYLRMYELLGYDIYDADEEASKVESIEPDDLIAKYPEDGILHTNIVCIKE